jgi:hypothetical protein
MKNDLKIFNESLKVLVWMSLRDFLELTLVIPHPTTNTFGRRPILIDLWLFKLIKFNKNGRSTLSKRC